MRIWVTRTEPGAARLAEALAGHGFDIFNAPVLHIERLRSSAPDGCFDLTVFVSEHAVAAAFANGWQGGPAMAIGNAAHAALERRGQVPTWSPQRSALDVTNALEPSVPGRTLVVKGAGGTDTLQRWLESRGGTVVDWDVYRRVANEPAIAHESIDAIVAASGEGLRVIGQLWFAHGRDPKVPLLVPSERVSAIAASAGFAKVITTVGASPMVVVDALVRLRRALPGALESSEEGI